MRFQKSLHKWCVYGVACLRQTLRHAYAAYARCCNGRRTTRKHLDAFLFFMFGYILELFLNYKAFGHFRVVVYHLDISHCQSPNFNHMLVYKHLGVFFVLGYILELFLNVLTQWLYTKHLGTFEWSFIILIYHIVNFNFQPSACIQAPGRFFCFLCLVMFWNCF